ncbi:Small ubiquitin-related modifier 5 [Hirschfeldia incana]|nr:Small ubiquitin-related modifier 5 [Hirschfeldia incana]
MVSSTTTISASSASEGSPSPSPQKKITLKVKTQQDGGEDVYKIGYGAHLKKLMDAYCTKRNLERTTVRFIFRYKELKPRQTPAQVSFLFFFHLLFFPLDFLLSATVN